MTGRVIGLDHVGIAVREPRKRLAIWADAIGLEVQRVEAVPGEGVRTWFLDAGGVHIELLEPLDDGSPVGKFLATRGEGVHHVCLAVDDIDAALARLARHDIEPVGGVRVGARGARIAFLHPRDMGGVLVEISQRKAASESADDAFAAGTLAVVYLRDPRELCIGVLHRLDSSGVVVEGMDLDAWGDWVAQWSRGERGPLTPSIQYFPFTRIEKILADRDTHDLPSYERQFRTRANRSLTEAIPSFRSGVSLEPEPRDDGTDS